MGCCIVVALLISQILLFWEKAKQHAWINALAIACTVLGAGLLIGHWHHIEELILHPFSFTFISDLLNGAEGFCRAAGII